MTPLARAAVLAALLPATPLPAATQPDAQDLKRLTLEELMQVDVTLVTRQPEPIGTAAAAVSIVTREDIRRSGVTTIADAIALAEGVHVARFNNGTWAITSRGFNASTANKLLVMIDGRTVYSPLFTGVFWNTVDYVLEDIERIEVVRGPGATLWGANAVNGVVNIVTRTARDTRGTLVSLASGNEDPAIVEARYGAGSDTLAWRAYAKYARRGAQRLASGGDGMDPVGRAQAGFRLDGGSAAAASWLLRGDAFHSSFGFPDRPDGEFTDLNAQARWSRPLGAAARIDVQSYYRHEYRRVPLQLTHRLHVADVDGQVTARAGTRHHVVAGAAYRLNHDATDGSVVVRFEPADRTYGVASAFVQDEMALRRDRLFLTAGLKVERNAFSGADWQPSVRARLMLPRTQMVWTALSRAVRRPTRFDADIVASTPGGVVLARGSDDFVSEKLTAWELGYRSQPSAAFAVDATVFLHDYDDLRSQEAPPAGAVPVRVGNSLNGRSAGVELALGLQPSPWWRSQVSYTYLDTDITRDAGSRDVGGGASEANDPHQLFSFRTMLDLPGNVELDAWVRGVGELPNPRVPGFAELNARAAWHVSPRLELAVVGQDLLHDRHPEFGADAPGRLEFQRSVRAQAILRLR
jgi:iron complex outermembrane receptor protein